MFELLPVPLPMITPDILPIPRDLTTRPAMMMGEMWGSSSGGVRLDFGVPRAALQGVQLEKGRNLWSQTFPNPHILPETPLTRFPITE